jgi:hypothetical protein
MVEDFSSIVIKPAFPMDSSSSNNVRVIFLKRLFLDPD